jgi:hypothetical protein
MGAEYTNNAMSVKTFLDDACQQEISKHLIIESISRSGLSGDVFPAGWGA